MLSRPVNRFLFRPVLRSFNDGLSLQKGKHQASFFHSGKAAAARGGKSSSIRFATTSGVIVFGLGMAAWIATSSPLYNDAPRSIKLADSDLIQQEKIKQRIAQQGVYAWGSNRYNVVAPDAPDITLVRAPRSIPFFERVALRDIVLEEKYGVAVDANGDIYQWGLGFFDPFARQPTPIEDIPLGRRREKLQANQVAPIGSSASKVLLPVRTLTGRNIVKVQATDDKVYALSKVGKVYVISAIQELQQPCKPADWNANPFSLFGALSVPTIDHEVLTLAPGTRFSRGEKVVEISAGNNHLLALSNKGRTFSLPINDQGNCFGQLGHRRVLLNAPQTPDSKAVTHVETVMEPNIFTDLDSPDGRSAPSPIHPSNFLPSPSSASDRTSNPVLQGTVAPLKTNPTLSVTEPATSIRFCTTLHEIPSLRQVVISQIATGSEHSLARTCNGRVLGWGRQTHGQLGMGPLMSLDCVPVPTEIVLSKCFPSSNNVKVTSIGAGADNSFFMTTRNESGSSSFKIDLLASGKGQWGTLGNAMWSQVAALPTRVKTVSGLLEYSELTNTIQPVPIYSFGIGKPGHCVLVLDTVEKTSSTNTTFGRDVMVWGANAAFQLGIGKRSNFSVPQYLSSLPSPTPVIIDSTNDTITETEIQNGDLPHNRLQLASKVKTFTNIPSSSGTPSQTKKNVYVEESIHAGTVSTTIYWKILG